MLAWIGAGGRSMMRRSVLILLLVGLTRPALAAEAATSAPAPAVAPKPAPSASERLPVSAFAQLPFVDQAAISPDGLRVAGLLGVGGVPTIAVIGLLKGDPTGIRIDVPDGTEVDWVRWANDDYVLAGLRERVSDLFADYYVTRILIIARATGKVTKPLWTLGGQFVSDVLWTPPGDGDNRILLAGSNSMFDNDDDFFPTVYEVNLATGRGRIAQNRRAGVSSWSADTNGVVRLGSGYRQGGKTNVLYYRRDANSAYAVVDSADTRKRESVNDPFLIRADSDIGLVAHDDDKGRLGIWEYDIAKQADVKQLAVGETRRIENYILSPDRTLLLGVSYVGGGTTWLDPALADLQAQLDKAMTAIMPGATASIASLNRDRTRMLVTVDGPDMPGVLYYFDIKDGRLLKIAVVNEALGTRRLAPVKLVHYKARDGLEIEAVLTLPAGRDPRALPLIVMPHGGPWAHDDLDYDYWAQFLANRGYAVIQPNYRGSTGYGEAFLRKGEGQMGLAMQDDLTDALRWTVAQGIADPKRVCIVGASYGGYAAMWGIVKDPAQYRCAIAIAGVSGVRRDVNDFGQYYLGDLYKADWQRMSPDFDAISPINFIPKITAPLLLIHGLKDVTVDYHQSQRMFDRMKQAGKTVEFVPLEKADHHFRRQADRQTLLEAMDSFLARYNPG